jgi:nitrous oxide reductase accessory protein NosL
MKSKTAYMLMLAAFLLAAGAAVAVGQMEDIKEHPSCVYCGMDRGKFSTSRMLIKYSDGTEAATCSLHCTALDLAINVGRSPAKIMVADYDTGELVDAERSSWVLGGEKPGVMSRRAKWAFSGKEGRGGFIEAHGGAMVSFEEALKASYEDMYEDTKMIREKRKKMKMKNM